MRARADQIKGLAENFSALIEQEGRACREILSSLIEYIRTMQDATADRRLQQLNTQLKALQQRLDLLIRIGRDDYLAKIIREADELKAEVTDGRLSDVITPLIDGGTQSLNLLCESLLDRVNEATGAERGFILFYLPESTEADVAAARNFQTRNLSLEEYDFSRTLLREIFRSGESLLLEDAALDPVYGKEVSVIRFQLKSVLAVPLKQGDRTIGAVYLENNTLARVFDEDDRLLLDHVARFLVFYFRHARLLPGAFERDSRVFLDASKASREIIGRDPKVLALLGMIHRIADSPATVLIEGESGTGKELVARALHFGSARKDRPFVAINCAAIPDNLLESELFGHEKGAFTGATERYIGRIERGDGGTIFLDEISELAYPLQAKLLRFLQSNEFERLGGNQSIKVDSRIVAATSKDLEHLMQAGKFQEALYYRLNVIPVRVPPLRERKDDIPILIDHFLNKASAIYARRVQVEPEAYELLKEYSFPGNVRELENFIHRLVALDTGDSICVGDLPKEILRTTTQRVSLEKDPLCRILQTPAADLADLRLRRLEVRRVLGEQEKELAERIIRESGGNLTEAASRMGVHRITLHKMVKRGREPK